MKREKLPVNPALEQLTTYGTYDTCETHMWALYFIDHPPNGLILAMTDRQKTKG